MRTRPRATLAAPFRRRIGQLLLAAALAVSLGSLPSQQVVAGNVPTSTASTWELVPESGIIRVTVVLTMTNQIPSTQQGNVITDYFINEGGIAVDPDGRNFRATTTGGSASVSVAAAEPGFLPSATIRFPSIFYNQSRTITITYDVPGAAPRSGNPTRAGMAYANFCAFPASLYEGDPDSFRIVVPGRFNVEQFAGDAMDRSVSDGKVVLARPTAPAVTEWSGACVEAVDETAFETAEHSSPGGIRVTTKAWPGDTEWTTAVSASVGPMLDALEAAIGRVPATDAITVQEVIGEGLGGYIGVFDPDTGIARVSEYALDPVVAAHELSHAWFNELFSDEIWLSEGHAEYYGRLVADAEPCAAPDQATVDLAVLADWAFLPALPTAEDEAVVDAQYAVACWVVTQVADAVGEDVMREIYAAAEDGEIAYLGGTEAEQVYSGILSWRDWLDLADERGVVPAGVEDLDWLQDLLLDTGAAIGTDALDRRSEARQRYHDLVAATDGWAVPFAIRGDMADWEFGAANDAMAVAEDLDAARDQAVDLVPELAESDAVESAYESAEDDTDLAAALDEATAELEAAEHVADAVAAAAAERNPIEAIGLLGDDLAADADSAVAQLVDAEFATATTTADELVQTAANSALSGGLRIGIVFLVMASLIGGTWYWRRRRSSEPAPQAAEPADALPAADADEPAEAPASTDSPPT